MPVGTGLKRGFQSQKIEERLICYKTLKQSRSTFIVRTIAYFKDHRSVL